MTSKKRTAMQPSQQAVTAMQQALEAFKEVNGLIDHYEYTSGLCYVATAALEEALAEQAEQEPVALIEECRMSLAQELLAYDIDPPIYHVKKAHDKCVAWLSNRIAPQPSVRVAPTKTRNN